MLTTIASVLKQKGHDVWSVPPAATVDEAIYLMTQKRIEALPVLSDGRLVGITSERDCARHVTLQGRDSTKVLVREIMVSPVVFVSPQHTVGDCLRILTDNHITHLPVVEGKAVVGVVSVGDLMRSLVSTHAETITHLEGYISGKYPG